MDTIINRTENGCVFRCQKCDLIHFEYKNLNFNFTDNEYYHFAAYFSDLQGDYYLSRNNNNNFTRKIVIPAGHQSFNILLNIEELRELKMLLNKSYNKREIELIKFNYRFCSN